MERVFSTRLDESLLDDLTRLAQRLGLSKKALLGELIRDRMAREESRGHPDVWAETAGSWKRRESPTTTVRTSRQAFREALEGHRQP